MRGGPAEQIRVLLRYNRRSENEVRAVQEFYELAVLVGFVVLGTALVLAGVMAVAARMDPSAGGLSHDGNGAAGTVHDGMTDRAEQHPLERAPATGAHDDQARLVR